MKQSDKENELDYLAYTVFDTYGDVIIQHELEYCPRWVVKLLKEILDLVFVSSECDVDVTWH